MVDSKFSVDLSEVDEQHFGVRTAQASHITVNNLDQVLDFCREHSVEFLVARCSVKNLDAVQLMEANGFQLMDTLIYYRLRLGNSFPYRENKNFDVSHVQPGEEEKIREITRAAFRDYVGHYHADSRLDNKKCDEVYANWAYQACLSRNSKKEVLVFKKDNALIGFIIVEINSEGIGVPSLTGISPEHQGAGLYGAIGYEAWKWFKKKGLTYTHASTQVANFDQLRNFYRFGYQPIDAVYTLHKWFD